MSVPADSGARAAPAHLATPRYPLLDSMRGVAALSVFAAHAVLFLLSTSAISEGSPLLTRLDPGIAIFLLLSAFLLYRPFVKARYEGRQGPAVIPFALRRLLRIVPVYWVALPIVGLYFGQDYLFTLEGIVTYFGFLQIYDAETITNGIGQAWTICVEMTFYVMLPVWALLLRRLPWRTTRGFLATELGALAAIFAFAVVWKIVVFTTTTDAGGVGIVKLTPGLFTLPAFLDALAVGMALAVASVVLADRPQPRVVALVDNKPWVVLVPAAVLYWLSGVAGGTFKVDGVAGYLLHQELNVLIAVCLFLPAIFGDWRRGWLRRLLANRVLVWMATISYGFYLWHLAVMQALADRGWLESPGPLAWLLASFAITTALGALSYYGVGRWFLKLGSRLPRGRGREPLARAHAETPTSPAPQPPVPTAESQKL